MARARTAEPPPAEPLAAELSDTEQAEAEEARRATTRTGGEAGEPESEVRADEFTRGTEAPAWRSPFPDEVVEVLRQPLDPDRVRRRAGRGGGQFEYLAGHDVKRRLTEIFGFGNWSTQVVELREEAQVEIEQRPSDGGGGYSENAAPPKRGWHLCYAAVVKLKVRTEHGDWVEYEDVGYGDGNEWGPAALATARELAMKEAVTDALKRAATPLGDQFGLILYAKADEKQRINRERNLEGAQTRQREPVRVDPPGPARPKSWAEAFDRFDKLVADEGQGQAWAEEILVNRFGVQSMGDLASDDRTLLSVAFFSALMALEGEEGEIALQPNLRDRIAAALAEKLKMPDGAPVALAGPPWRIGPGEETLPSHEEFNQGQRAPQEEEASDVPAGL